MGPLSCLDDPSVLLVADTSVVINLNATGCAADILDALPNRLVIVDVARSEIEVGRDRGRSDSKLTEVLVRGKHITLVSLGAIGLGHFEGLVVGAAAETLDDGEAATLAYALERGGTVIIDERKALRICATRFAKLATASTLDILGHPEVFKALGADQLAEAVFLALQDARMRVFDNHIPWVVDLIGHERASTCPSLPRSARKGAGHK